MNFIAIDFETANSYRTSICSLGIAIVEKGQLIGTEHFFVKPTPNYYDGFNTDLHGISDRQTRTMLTFGQQWKDLAKYFNNQVIVAHNAAFDCSVLRSSLEVAELAYPDLDFHCTYRLAKETLPLISHKLNEVARHFKIELKHHDAESDAKASAIIALKLCEKYKVSSLDELSTSLGFKVGKMIGDSNRYKPFSKTKIKAKK